MKKIVLLLMLMASFQVAIAQKKAPSRSSTAFVFEVDAVRNLDNGEIDESSCQVTRQASKIIWKTDGTTLVFTITRTVWKSKTHVEFYASRGSVDAKWIFKESDGQQKIAFFTESVAMEMHVADSYTKAL
jgi:hypothetical protein